MTVFFEVLPLGFVKLIRTQNWFTKSKRLIRYLSCAVVTYLDVNVSRRHSADQQVSQSGTKCTSTSLKQRICFPGRESFRLNFTSVSQTNEIRIFAFTKVNLTDYRIINHVPVTQHSSDTFHSAGLNLLQEHELVCSRDEQTAEDTEC